MLGAHRRTERNRAVYAVSPPGVGDNGNWSPIAVKTIANIPASGFMDTFCNWVPAVDKHTCLKVFASQQLCEISGDNNGAQENVFDFQAAGSSPANPVFIRTAVRNPSDERRAIHLSLERLPLGWVAQIPQAWVWLDGKSEREIDVMIWPITDVNMYKVGKNREGKLPGSAPVRVAGFIERNYTEAMGPALQVVGSRFFPIGGTFYRVSVRKRATIRLEASKDERRDTIRGQGAVGPARADQRVLIDVTLPDGATHRVAEIRTRARGQFTAQVKVLDDKKKLQPGAYTVQGFIHNADELADAESNVVTVMKWASGSIHDQGADERTAYFGSVNCIGPAHWQAPVVRQVGGQPPNEGFVREGFPSSSRLAWCGMPFPAYVPGGLLAMVGPLCGRMSRVCNGKRLSLLNVHLGGISCVEPPCLFSYCSV